MILNLCQHAQEFLHTHNAPPKPSFHEEMMTNQRKEAERKAQERMQRDELLRQNEQKQVTSLHTCIF